MEFILLILAAYIGYQIYVMVYFKSDKFKTIKNSVEEYTANCNDLNHHIQELKNAYVDINSYDYGNINKAKLKRKLGFEDIDFSTLYFPVYTFQYISAGGNSSAKCEIILDIDNLNRFVGYLNTLVKFKKSIAGQRALMTSTLREKIKIRDNYTCQSCGISAHETKHLLLEIDHMLPLSRGGETTESNLQTLCWKCNRTKGSKIIA